MKGACHLPWLPAENRPNSVVFVCQDRIAIRKLRAGRRAVNAICATSEANQGSPKRSQARRIKHRSTEKVSMRMHARLETVTVCDASWTSLPNQPATK